jgi:hypothetical protein
MVFLESNAPTYATKKTAKGNTITDMIQALYIFKSPRRIDASKNVNASAVIKVINKCSFKLSVFIIRNRNVAIPA